MKDWILLREKKWWLRNTNKIKKIQNIYRRKNKIVILRFHFLLLLVNIASVFFVGFLYIFQQIHFFSIFFPSSFLQLSSTLANFLFLTNIVFLFTNALIFNCFSYLTRLLFVFSFYLYVLLYNFIIFYLQFFKHHISQS